MNDDHKRLDDIHAATLGEVLGDLVAGELVAEPDESWVWMHLPEAERGFRHSRNDRSARPGVGGCGGAVFSAPVGRG